MIRKSGVKLRRVQVKRRRTGPPRRSPRILDPAYLDFLRSLPCVICYGDAYEWLFKNGCYAETLHGRFYVRQKSPTEAAHVGISTSHRGASQKHNDAEAIPLCAAHHREGPDSIHKLNPDAFFARHGADRDATILSFQRLYAEHCR